MTRLGDAREARTPKVRRLCEARNSGIPVPEGVVWWPGEAASLDATVQAATELGFPLVARGAALVEDTDTHSAAGLGRSFVDLRDAAALRGALVALAEGADEILIQCQIERQLLLVMARERHGAWYLEAHDAAAGPLPLASGRAPVWSGALLEWSHPARDALATLAAAAEELGAGPVGVELEVVIDPENEPYLVQTRPLTAPLEPGWLPFVEALAEEGVFPAELDGCLELDAEHNPAPLSPAHAWIIDELRAQRGARAGNPRVLAGWLFVHTLPRELCARAGTEAAAADPVTALERLHTVHLPRAREVLLEVGSCEDPAQGLERAWAGFLEAIDAYVGELVPARGAVAPDRSGDRERPLSLSDRARHLDVLPAVWDIASPSLAELGAQIAPAAPTALDPGRAAAAIAEQDDHLFALGLAALRQAYLLAAPARSLSPEDAFMLRGDELFELEPGPARDELINARRARLRACAQLRPPRRIVDGQAVPAFLASRERGHPVGPSARGFVTHRADLAALLADPPEPDSVLVMPTLTAPAAVVLARQQVKAVCTWWGGALSHGTLIARELGLSALIGVRASEYLPEGSEVIVDTDQARLRPIR